MSDESKPSVTSRQVALVVGRATTGVIVTAIAAVVAIGSTFIVPKPIVATAPAAITVAPDPAPQQLVCAGGLLALAQNGGSAEDLSALGAPSVAWTPADAVAARGTGKTNAGTAGTPAAAALGTVAAGTDAASGFQSELLLGSTRGLATASCASPVTDQWLVAGATTLGRASLLVLTNPDEVDAEVTLQLYGEAGPVAAAGLDGIRLGPDEQRVIPLNGFATDLEAPVVRVTSTGGRVAAALEETIARTLVAGGADWAGSQQPARSLVIPGVRVTDPNALAPLDVSEIDHDDTLPVLRLLSPGDGTAPVTATVSWIPTGSTLADALAKPRAAGSQGQAGSEDQGNVVGGAGDRPTTPKAAPQSLTEILTPGVTAELPLDGIGPGDYTVVVTAKASLVGAVRTSVIASRKLKDPVLAGKVDFAWSQPAAALGDTATVTVPRVAGTSASPNPVASTLWIANPGAAAATVDVTIGSGAAKSIAVAPGAAAAVRLAAGTVATLRGTAGLSVAIESTGAGLLAQSPLQPPPSAASAVRIHLG